MRTLMVTRITTTAVMRTATAVRQPAAPVSIGVWRWRRYAS
jgi:hypothetical protein